MNVIIWALAGVCVLGGARLDARSQIEGSAPVGLQTNVVFTQYSSFSTAAEIVRRMFTPLEARRVRQGATLIGKSMQGQPLDLAGERFSLYVPRDAPPVSRQSMSTWCVFDVSGRSIPALGHELPDASTVDRLLDELDAARSPDAAKLAECRARLDASLDAALHQVQDLAHTGKLEKARRALDHLDARFGGLAAPRSVELADALNGSP